MAEVGLRPLARVALQVATLVLPPYRTRFTKHQFTQPPLLAVLCLMRYEDWTFREAEVRLREHRELRGSYYVVSAVDARFGRNDIRVTNSGGPPSNCLRTPPEAWRTAVDQLLMSTVYFARETLPRMRRQTRSLV